MKIRVFAALWVMAVLSIPASAQNTTEITKKNSWLKLGINAGVPVGNASNYSSFTPGIELKGQLMETNHVGIGLTTGYNHFYGKENFKDFGTVPLGAFIRVYPASQGFFAGTDAGYSIVTGTGSSNGGFYVRPQLGYHDYNWNFFGYYNNVFRDNPHGGSIGSVGIGATYNIRFH